MSEHALCKDYIHGSYSSKDRILLINPPVIEIRYPWVKWNQPLDLLKLGNYLKSEIGCSVKLYDFMLPKNGKVSRKINENEPMVRIGNISYPLWYYGKSLDDFRKYLDNLISSWMPTAIWITSLTSYWWKGIFPLIINIKNKIQDKKVVLYGNYPRLETAHADVNSFADVIITDSIDLSQYAADFELYDDHNKPSFCALDMRSESLIYEIKEKMKLGIKDFTFFNDNIIDYGDANLLSKLDHIACIVKSCKQSEQPRFHGICGLYPRLFTPDVAVGMKMANFTELHFEYQTLKNGELDIDAYLMLKESYDKAGFMLSTEFFTGFINIGLPDDNLEIIIRHALNILEIMGSVIPKPYTPVPGTEVYKKYSCIINKDQIEMPSPHLFPLSSINGIMPEDYNELYRLMAFLNYKARQKTFDLFPPRVGFHAFRDSLRKEIWKIGEKEVSTSD